MLNKVSNNAQPSEDIDRQLAKEFDGNNVTAYYIYHTTYSNVEEMNIEQKRAAFTYTYEGPEIDLGIKTKTLILCSPSYQAVLSKIQNITTKAPVISLQEDKKLWVSRLFFDAQGDVYFNRPVTR